LLKGGKIWVEAKDASRKALLIGNNYKGSKMELQSCVNDAHAMAEQLQKTNFTVTIETNLKYLEIKGAIQKFIKSLKRGDVALFYFSGHGISFDGVMSYMFNTTAYSKRQLNIYRQLNIQVTLGVPAHLGPLGLGSGPISADFHDF